MDAEDPGQLPYSTSNSNALDSTENIWNVVTYKNHPILPTFEVLVWGSLNVGAQEVVTQTVSRTHGACFSWTSNCQSNKLSF